MTETEAVHPFRFGASIPAVSSRREWLDRLRMAEDVGCSTVFVTDHLSDKPAPIPALASAAELTTLRVGSLVLANDFRNPAILAKEAATIDLLSDGRLELGLGAGWLRSDYERAGIRFDPPAVRVDRLEESIAVLKGLWTGTPFRFEGRHHRLEWAGRPVPPDGGPTLLVGGGGPRMLRLAGREADIVGISVKLDEGTRDQFSDEVSSVTDERLERRVAWIRDGAGDRFPGLELNVLVFGVRVGPDRRRLARELTGDAAAGLSTPHYLAGTVEQICEELRERRARFGISYVVLDGNDLEVAAPVVERLAGT